MNCIAKSVARALNRRAADIYTGVGHAEPIHMSEVVAWLLTLGYAAVPQQTLNAVLSKYPGVVEGENAAGDPHMVTVAEHSQLVKIFVVWYFIPVPINPEYVRRYNEILCVGMPPRHVHERLGRSDG